MKITNAKQPNLKVGRPCLTEGRLGYLEWTTVLLEFLTELCSQLVIVLLFCDWKQEDLINVTVTTYWAYLSIYTWGMFYPAQRMSCKQGQHNNII